MILPERLAKSEPPRPVRGGSRSESGFILIAVLWFGVGLAAISSFLALSAQVQTRRAIALEERARLEVETLDAATQWTLAALHAGDPALAPNADETGVVVLSRDFGGRPATITVHDAFRVVDLNGADLASLTALLTGEGLSLRDAQALAAQIIDFRDADDLRMIDGAERAEYEAAGRTGPRNAPFLSPDELALVLDMPLDLAERIAPKVLTVPPPPPPAPQNVQIVGGKLTATNGPRRLQFVRRPLYVVEIAIPGTEAAARFTY